MGALSGFAYVLLSSNTCAKIKAPSWRAGDNTPEDRWGNAVARHEAYTMFGTGGSTRHHRSQRTEEEGRPRARPTSQEDCNEV